MSKYTCRICGEEFESQDHMSKHGYSLEEALDLGYCEDEDRQKERQKECQEWEKEFDKKVEPLRQRYLNIKDRVDYEETCDVEISWTPITLGREPGEEDWSASAKRKLEGITDIEYLRSFVDWLDVEEAMEDGIIQAFVDYYKRLLELYRTHDRVKVTYNEEAKEKLRKVGLRSEAEKIFYVFRRKQK